VRELFSLRRGHTSWRPPAWDEAAARSEVASRGAGLAAAAGEVAAAAGRSEVASRGAGLAAAAGEVAAAAGGPATDGARVARPTAAPEAHLGYLPPSAP
jgi:hypothetical protein